MIAPRTNARRRLDNGRDETFLFYVKHAISRRWRASIFRYSRCNWTKFTIIIIIVFLRTADVILVQTETVQCSLTKAKRLVPSKTRNLSVGHPPQSRAPLNWNYTGCSTPHYNRSIRVNSNSAKAKLFCVLWAEIGIWGRLRIFFLNDIKYSRVLLKCIAGHDFFWIFGTLLGQFDYTLMTKPKTKSILVSNSNWTYFF